MTDRSITIRLKADVAQALAGIRATSTAVKDFAGQTALASVKQKESFDKVGKAAVIGGALIVGGLLEAVHAAAAFDKAMSTVSANVDDKSAPSLARLRQAALDAAQDQATAAFSATQAAEAENELAKAGVSAADIIGGSLHAALVLASAGQIDAATASEILSATLVQFNLHGKDAAHVADLLSAGADKALGGVQDLGEALKYVGVNASQMGVSVDQTVGTLALFAKYGILGSMAGTGLRQIMLSLASPTMQAGGEMQKYGINVFDATGKFIGLDKVAGVLHDRLGNLTQAQQQAALSTIFTARSVTEANILMKEGAAGVDEMTAAVNDQGFAAKQASTKLDNLSGDLTKLKNTFNVALIETGTEATGVLRGLTQETTNLITAYTALSPTAKGVVASVAGIAGAGLLLGGSLLIAIPKVVAFRTALLELTGAETVTKALKSVTSFMLGPWGLALAAGTIALGLFVKHHIDAAARVNDLTAAIKADSGALGENTRQTVINQLQKQGLLDDARKLGIGLQDLADAALDPAGAAAQRVSATLDQFSGSAHTAMGRSDALYHAAKDIGNALGDTHSELGKATQAAKDNADAMGKDAEQQTAAATAGHQLTTTVKTVAGQVKAATFDVTAFDNALKGLYNSTFSVGAAQDKLTSDFHALAKQAKDSGTAVHGNSTAALANRDALRNLAQDALGLVQAYADTGASSDQVARKSDKVRDAFIRQAEKAGFTKGQIAKYIGVLDDVPTTVNTNVTTTGLGSASQAVRNYASLVNGVKFGVIANFRSMERAAESAPTKPHHASGTTDAPGGLTKVGERGPEWVYMPEHSRVWPSGQAPTFPGPQGGGGIALTVQKVDLIRGGPQDVADALAFTMAARGRG